MVVYNLTDVPPPWNSKRPPRTLKFRGAVIEPGRNATVPDRPLRELAGWIASHTVSVDCLPEWYQVVKKAQRKGEKPKDQLTAVPPPTPPKKVEDKGPDVTIELDDEPVVKRAKSGKKRKKAKSDD